MFSKYGGHTDITIEQEKYFIQRENLSKILNKNMFLNDARFPQMDVKDSFFSTEQFDQLNKGGSNGGDPFFGFADPVQDVDLGGFGETGKFCFCFFFVLTNCL